MDNLEIDDDTLDEGISALVERVVFLLRAEMAAQGISKSALCRRSGVSATHLNNIMNQETELTFSAFVRISHALKIRPVISFEKK